MTDVGKNKSHPCARNCALTNFLFFKVEKSWKKYFWNTLLLAPQDPILGPPMTSKDPKTININKKYTLNKKYIVFSSYDKKTGHILNLKFWGATLGLPGGLQEAPHAIFCMNKTIILPWTCLPLILDTKPVEKPHFENDHFWTAFVSFSWDSVLT